MKKTLKSTLSGLFDINDVVTLAGLVMLGIGLWWVYPPAAPIIIGAILVLLGVFT